MISEITETHIFGCNEKGKFIELPVTINRRFFIIGEKIKHFDNALLLSVDGECCRVYWADDGKSLISL